jgi:flagellin-like hook-associated protein FlgL
MTSISLLGRLETDSAALRLRLEQLTRQASTGRKTDAIGDLAPQLPRALTLRGEIGRREAYGSAIGEALGRATTTGAALQRLSTIAGDFANGVAMKLDPNDPGSLSLVAARARAAMVEVGQLLNSRSNGEYLFGGSDFANPPVPDRKACRPPAWRGRSPAWWRRSAAAMRPRSRRRRGRRRWTTARG